MTIRERIAREMRDACEICVVNDYHPSSDEEPCEDCMTRALIALSEFAAWLDERAAAEGGELPDNVQFVRRVAFRRLAAELRGGGK